MSRFRPRDHAGDSGDDRTRSGSAGWPRPSPRCSSRSTRSARPAAGSRPARLPFVAGIDRFLPAAFGALHPKYGTPHVALLVQAAIAAVFVFLGQAGTTVQGAYDVLVSMGIIAYFMPFLFMFAAMIRAAARAGRARGDAGARRPPVAIALAAIGFLATARVDRAGVHPGGRRGEQAAGGAEDRRAVGAAAGRRRGGLCHGKRGGAHELASRSPTPPARGWRCRSRRRWWRCTSGLSCSWRTAS